MNNRLFIRNQVFFGELSWCELVIARLTYDKVRILCPLHPRATALAWLSARAKSRHPHQIHLRQFGRDSERMGTSRNRPLIL
jgi:hypothetical protein